MAERLAGLFSRHAGQPPSRLTPALEGRILEWSVKRKPGDGSTQWSSRKLAEQLGLSHMMVARVWRKHALRPHRLEGYMASNDPDFETKAAEIIGLYLHPPQHAAVFCVDEKTAIQALDRKDPVLPLSAGRAERHGFEYFRHGTLSLYAAFNTKTGEVLGKTAARHTSAEFVAFLTDIVANQSVQPLVVPGYQHIDQPVFTQPRPIADINALAKLRASQMRSAWEQALVSRSLVSFSVRSAARAKHSPFAAQIAASIL